MFPIFVENFVNTTPGVDFIVQLANSQKGIKFFEKKVERKAKDFFLQSYLKPWPNVTKLISNVIYVCS